MKTILFVFATLSLLASPAFAGLSEGEEAYDREDYVTALKHFMPLAQKGDSRAQNHLGVMYLNGQGVPKSREEAAKWYQLAADQGLPLAQYNLGVMYKNGQGVPQSDQEAVKWYRLAADQGNSTAQLVLGLMYAEGEGVPENMIVAYALVSLAAASEPNDDFLQSNRDNLAGKISKEHLDIAQALSLEIQKPGNLLVALDEFLNRSR